MQPSILNNLLANANDFRISCDSCARCLDLDGNARFEQYGSVMPRTEIGCRSRCKACEAKRDSV